MSNVAVLDDWQHVAHQSADWSSLESRAKVVFFRTAFADEDEAAEKLADFEIIMAMRERTPFPGSLVGRLPKLRMFNLTGRRAQAIDFAALIARGVTVCCTGGGETGEQPAQLALGLMLAAARGIASGDASMRAGSFQESVGPGMLLSGRTLGVIGLGRIGSLMARYGQVLGMNVVAWSQELEQEPAKLLGVETVSKNELLARSDVVSLHLVLSARTRATIGRADLARMKPGAILVNTSRGPLVDEVALLEAVRSGRVVAALDVYDREPLQADHPLRVAPNTTLTPHLGYCTDDVYREFYGQGVANVLAFLDGKPTQLYAAPVS